MVVTFSSYGTEDFDDFHVQVQILCNMLVIHTVQRMVHQHTITLDKWYNCKLESDGEQNLEDLSNVSR